VNAGAQLRQRWSDSAPFRLADGLLSASHVVELSKLTRRAGPLSDTADVERLARD